MRKEPIRVLIADDHAMVRSGLRLFLMAFEDLKMVGEAGSGQEVIEICAREHPDVILMDLIMPGMDGIRTTQEIHTRFSKTRVIGMTSFQDANLIREMLDAGAVSFLMKNVSSTELAEAIRNAAKGKATFSAEVHEILKAPAPVFTPASRGGDYNLSEREKQVLTCLVAGMSNAEIAQELVISLSTAKYHVSSILMKLEASNRAEAVSLALQERLIDSSALKRVE
ncbi:MAG TPA: response regulator transcription factor [Anaerolineales bacterium]|nr:response regulator transcription factor [Anaerolineales bacterium]